MPVTELRRRECGQDEEVESTGFGAFRVSCGDASGEDNCCARVWPRLAYECAPQISNLFAIRENHSRDKSHSSNIRIHISSPSRSDQIRAKSGTNPPPSTKALPVASISMRQGRWNSWSEIYSYLSAVLRSPHQRLQLAKNRVEAARGRWNHWHLHRH